MHHAWLFAGPEGVGKGTFARAAAARLLAESASPGTLGAALDLPADNPTRALIAAGSHPDFRLLQRLPKDADKPRENLARSITIAQVRTLQAMFATTPSMSPRRVVLIDAVPDLARGGANALLKSPEEPSASPRFPLLTHPPGRLLPPAQTG